MNKIAWCIDRHERTNHMYDEAEGVPYSFHLKMAAEAFDEFKHLLDDEDHYWGNHLVNFHDGPETLRNVCGMAVWAHDLIEDTRTSYNDVRQHLGHAVADVVYALTNDKGRDRAERAGETYYAGIRATKGAVFVKMCDRLANVRYGAIGHTQLWTARRMFELYRDENPKFIAALGPQCAPGGEYYPMVQCLQAVFDSRQSEDKR